jgi:hypothetical protein
MSVNAALIRAIRGPILLIAFGALLAIDRAGGIRFGQSWPTLIILLGVFKLIERMVPPAPVTVPPYGFPQSPYGPAAYQTPSAYPQAAPVTNTAAPVGASPAAWTPTPATPATPAAGSEPVERKENY